MGTRLPSTVRSLGVVSLLNDAASEMVYPLLPSFLISTLGASPSFLGVVEGMAEAFASLLKVVSGWIADHTTRRKGLVLAGYALSTAARPLFAIAQAPLHVLAIRLSDRAGKGVRSAPRDALLAAVTPPESRGRAFGLQRAMDNAGAVVGPLVASSVLFFRHDLRLLFLLTLIPGLACVLAVVFGVAESPGKATPRPQGISSSQSSRLGTSFTLYLAVLAVFTLGNSSDTFLLLRAQESGVALSFIPLLWAFHNLVKAGLSTHAGGLSDRLGRKRAIVLGWTVYALSYFGFSLATRAAHAWALFGIYAVHYAFAEGPERALVADLTGEEVRGRAFGLYHAVTGAMLLPASVLTGALWKAYGGGVALLVGALLAFVAVLGLLLLVPAPRAAAEPSPRGSH
jgi:MFS family permease